jgi:predicted metal-binding membrane protein
VQSAARVAPLPKLLTATIVAALLVCAAAAWLFIGMQSASMGMGGMAIIGPGLFLVIWLVMMIAMMFPSVAPMVLAHASIARSRGDGSLPLSTLAFVGGYLAAWTAAGLVPLTVIQFLNHSTFSLATSTLVRLGGVVILVAGIYQFTPLKNVCLRSCRSPLGFIMTHDFGGGARAAARAGLSHGLYCLGCCWAVMGVLAVVGLMNVAWMAAVAAVFFLEKNWRYGVPLARVVGTACVTGGLLVMASPAVLSMVGGPTV